MKKKSNNLFQNSANHLLTCFALLLSISAFAQDKTPKAATESTVFSNPLFDGMLAIVILLLIIIFVMGKALVNTAKRNDKSNSFNNGGKIVGVITLIFLLSSGNSSFAQTVVPVANSSDFMGLSSSVFYLLTALIVFELLIIMVLKISYNLILKNNVGVNGEESEEASFLERFNASVAVEREEEILMDHNYDGIRELDNDLPPWWIYGFYFTILVAILYMGYYYVYAPGNLQADEYNKSMVEAKNEKAEFDKNNGNSVNENNVLMLTDKAEIAKGQQIFESTCFACHGKLGEGGVGPNLTDDYWIHGGSIKNIFSTIKYGWPDKGMKSWQADLTATQINEIASYIKTLRGSNPPNGKAPQGDLFAEANGQNDSLKKDSVQVILPKVDSAKVGHK